MLLDVEPADYSAGSFVFQQPTNKNLSLNDFDIAAI